MNKALTVLVVSIGLLGLGYAVGRYLQPTKVEIKKEVIIQKEIHTVIKKVTDPNGTITEVTVIDDKSNEASKESTTITAIKSQWRAQGLVGFGTTKIGPIYGVGIERRILGPISAGLYGNTNNELGVSVSIEF